MSRHREAEASVRPQLHRPGAPGALALETLRAAELPSGSVYAYPVGESALVTGGRRYLVGERQVPKHNVDFIGYWRHGHAASS